MGYLGQLFLCATLALALVACGGDGDDAEETPGDSSRPTAPIGGPVSGSIEMSGAVAGVFRWETRSPISCTETTVSIALTDGSKNATIGANRPPGATVAALSLAVTSTRYEGAGAKLEMKTSGSKRSGTLEVDDLLTASGAADIRAKGKLEFECP